ncbi:hypothetical protein [Methylobacterium oryzihabitans]|uniref:RiboL-PSP-HEPN domain-containing protein n=1 Tax=Methylobacterium oryzihabitans TaxID=2499852 RepID=A0A3S2V4G0_9HYPH|nr:hypothetical protein [Methylobacterium oryzihabitans]RVU15334.1 hypothetical protein EOE48_20085 [Methylobacterium oryzihabitans]
MPDPTPIDAAYRRGQILMAILTRLREQALANPAHPRWVELGLCPAYETKRQAVADLQATFADLLGLVGHLTLLDMAASFEVASQARLGTRLGEVRSALAAGGRKRVLPPYALRLVRDRDEFGSLRAVAALLDGEADEALLDAFDAVRQARNNFAHGTEILSAPVADPDAARDTLNAVLGLL